MTSDATRPTDDGPPRLPIGEPLAGWKARDRPDGRTLAGERFELVRLDADRDGAELHRRSHGSEDVERLWTYMVGGPYRDADELSAWYRAFAGADDPLFYSVRARANGALVGVVSYLAIEPAHGALELGHIWYAPAWQGTAANTEACYLLLREAFDRLGYRRVEWKCDALNARSRAAALRLGFAFEGLFRKHRIVRGCNRDTAWFALLDDEWPRVRAAMERWLAWDDARAKRPALATLVAEQRD